MIHGRSRPGIDPSVRPSHRLWSASETSLRAILFTDLEGSTALAAKLGDEPARKLIRTQYEAVCDESITRHQGHVFKRLGVCILADLPSPRWKPVCGVVI